MAMNPVGWFEIYVSDIEKGAKFYEAVLGVKLTEIPAPVDELKMRAFPMEQGAPGAAGAICQMQGVPTGGNSTLVYFTCEDCATEAARVEPARGKLMKPKFSIGEYGFIAIASDPDGNMIGLHSRQ